MTATNRTATTALSMPTGRVVTLLGIDGSGKSTVAEALRKRLEGMDIKAEHLSRRDYLLGKPAGQVADLNRALYDATLRALFTGAVTPDGEHLADEMPAEGNLREPLLERALGSAEVARNTAQTVLASAVAEIAGGMAYRETVLRPRTDQGDLVLIEAPNPLRAVLKTVLMVQNTVGEGGPLHHAASAVLDLAMSLLRPNSSRIVPVLVQCTPVVAYERRMLQSGYLGPLEHYGVVGGPTTRAAYLDLQHGVHDVLVRRVEADWRCVVVDMDGARDEAVPAAVDAILGDERMRL